MWELEGNKKSGEGSVVCVYVWWVERKKEREHIVTKTRISEYDMTN